MTLKKGAKFWNNKKNDWFSHQTGWVFVRNDVFKDWSCCCANSTIFTGKNGYALKAASDTISYFVDMFLHFFRKCQLLSVSLTFCFISKINYKNENWYHCWFHLINRSNHQHMSWNMLLIKCRKKMWRSSFFKKLKTEIIFLIQLKF